MLNNYFIKHEVKPKILIKPANDLGIIVVIPSYNEPELEKSLESLLLCTPPKCSIEVITVINYPENSPKDVVENASTCIDIVNRFDKKSNSTKLRFFSLLATDLPKKHAGVGLARKIGMDEAALRFYSIDNTRGIIDCYDADSNCRKNYLVELEKLWIDYPKTHACSIRYEHPIQGNEFDERVYKGIAQYELHLRYYNQASRYVNFPFAFHTVGSSMACCAESYVKFGGMNRHQAGEDFYFLQKIIPHGNFKELNSTCVYPSPRPSHRVPFGTGRAMSKYLENAEELILTYSFESWQTLIPLFGNIDFIYNANNEELNTWICNLHPALTEYLKDQNINQKILEIKCNTSSIESFKKRFFFWFNAFMLLKYLNFAHESFFQRKPVDGESINLAKAIGLKLQSNPNYFDLLKSYREKDYLK